MSKLSHIFINFKSKRFSNQRNKLDSDAHKLIATIKQENKNQSWATLDDHVLDQVANDATVFRNQAKEIVALEESKVFELVDQLYNNRDYQSGPETYVRAHLDHVVPMLLYAWNVANQRQFPKDTQIVAFLLFVHSKHSLLEQIKTGEGKTLVVGLTAAFMALCGRAVDIVSSNRDLAIEGVRKCASFYRLLRLDSGHICTDDDKVKQLVYKLKDDAFQGNIVYGEVGSFQRDILEHECNNKNIFGKRYLNRKKCLIVDEVDSMCLDKARNVLYLSHEMDCLKWLEPLFIIIKAAVMRVNLAELVDGDVTKQVQIVADYITENLSSRSHRIQVPVYLDKYVRSKISRWVESAFQARMMKENDNFILGIKKILFIIDKSVLSEHFKFDYLMVYFLTNNRLIPLFLKNA